MQASKLQEGARAVRRLRHIAAVALDRAARLYADVRRRLRGNSSTVPAGLEFVDRSDVTRWVAETARVQETFRSSVEPADGSVAIVCSSHRPSDLDTVLRSVGGQSHGDVELVFVAHGDDWNLPELEQRLSDLERVLRRVQLLAVPSSKSLGACLNTAMDHTDARFVAKFDSDDRYGPEYLSDALRAHRLADAGVVGKHTYYAYRAAVDRYLLRFPGHEFEYSSTLAGGTLVIDRNTVGAQRFADISLGEDRDFIRRCHRRGISTFSGDRFNHVLMRSGANTWTISDEAFAEDALCYPAGWDPVGIER